jgi:hypothetical protein
VAHIGEELRLVLARLCKLASFLLDLMEQARILDRQDRLRGEGLQQFDGVLGKLLWPARASSCAGKSRPSALAVFILMTSLYLVGACTGRSAGFSPLRTDRPASRPRGFGQLPNPD